MANMEKLKLINSMPVIESDACSGELQYVYVENSQTNRDILKQIGVSEDEMSEMTDTNQELIDVSAIGFSYCGAKWFQDRFLDYIPEDHPHAHHFM